MSGLDRAPNVLGSNINAIVAKNHARTQKRRWILFF